MTLNVLVASLSRDQPSPFIACRLQPVVVGVYHRVVTVRERVVCNFVGSSLKSPLNFTYRVYRMHFCRSVHLRQVSWLPRCAKRRARSSCSPAASPLYALSSHQDCCVAHWQYWNRFFESNIVVLQLRRESVSSHLKASADFQGLKTISSVDSR